MTATVAEYETAQAAVGSGQGPNRAGPGHAGSSSNESRLHGHPLTGDGTIIDRRVNIGQTVVASLSAPSLFLIAQDLKKVQIWAERERSRYWANPRRVMTADFTVDALPNRSSRESCRRSGSTPP